MPVKSGYISSFNDTGETVYKVTWGNFGNGVTLGILSSDDYNSSLLPAIQ